MSIKWTVKDAIESLKNLTNPFEQAGMQGANQKPRLSDILNNMENIEDNTTGEVEISNGIT